MRERTMKSTTPDETKKLASGARQRKKYLKPEIISSSAEELLDRIGSARACSPVGPGAMGWSRQDLNP